MKVFFYGLFMDESLLAGKGVRPAAVSLGFVRGYRLRIGERATLVHDPSGRAYGAMMEITPSEAADLYAEQSVADYVPEAVIVELLDGCQVEASCYNLPVDNVTVANREYAQSLLMIATRLGFPDSYLDQIRQARS
jgi:hypothetical protein